MYYTEVDDKLFIGRHIKWKVISVWKMSFIIASSRKFKEVRLLPIVVQQK